MKLDIVIPVLRGDPNLASCLAQLQIAIHQTGDSERTTTPAVYVVCEPTQAGTDDWERDLRNRFPQLSMQFLPCAGSVAERRNVGARAGQAPFVAFLDSDVLIAPDGLTQLLRLAEEKQAMAGYAGATPLVGLESHWGSASHQMPYGTAFEFALAGYPLIWAPTTLLLIRRSQAGALPWFQSFAPPRDCSEDVEFGCRLTAMLGHPAIATTGTVVAVHAASAWGRPRPALERAWRFGKGDAALLRTHPSESLPATPALPAALGVVVLAFRERTAVPVLVAALLSGLGNRKWPHSPEYLALIGLYRTSEHWHRLRAGKIGRRFIFHEYQSLGHISTVSRRAWRDIATLIASAVIVGGRRWFRTRW